MEPVLFSNTQPGREAFAALAHRAVNWIVQYYSQLESFPVRSQVAPGEVYAKFPSQPPAQPVSDEDVFKMLDEVIIPGMTHWQHPNFYAFFLAIRVFHLLPLKSSLPESQHNACCGRVLLLPQNWSNGVWNGAGTCWDCHQVGKVLFRIPLLLPHSQRS